MLELIIVIVLIMWLGGFALGVAGGLIHVLLVVALVIFLIRMLQGNPPRPTCSLKGVSP
jgi:Family of unknown function (DUF5670)